MPSELEQKIGDLDTYTDRCTLCIIKPDGYKIKEKIYEILRNNGLTVNEVITVNLTLEDILTIYPSHRNAPFLKEFTEYMTSGPVEIIKVIADYPKQELYNKLCEIVGSTFPKTAAEGTIRQIYGKEFEGSRVVYNVIHSPRDEEEENRIKKVMLKYLNNK